jgi:pimeloyl-ACP methyl ester carboxylesterase
MGETYAELSNKTVSAANGVEYVYRDAGEAASSRRVVTFDNVGVGGTTGNTPHRVEQMAQDAIAFLTAMEFDQVDTVGFSIGRLGPTREIPDERTARQNS